jgi:hypothetical protein
MVEDLIKRLRDTVDEEAGHGVRNEAADLIEQQAARIAELEAAIRKQANAARSLADATIRDASIRQGLAEKAYAESSPEVLASERQANAMLTEENERLTARLTALESERDALLAAAGKSRKVPPEIVMAIQAYGDARADNVEAVSQLTNVITLIRSSYTAPTAALENGDGRDAWISVDDRLPKQNEVVLITGWSRCRGEATNVRFKVIAMHMDGTFYNDENGDDFYPPTHWMEIPAPPAALSQKAGEQQ